MKNIFRDQFPADPPSHPERTATSQEIKDTCPELAFWGGDPQTLQDCRREEAGREGWPRPPSVNKQQGLRTGEATE